MFHLLIQVDIHSDDKQQCETVGRKINDQIKAVTKGAPYRVAWKMKAIKSSPKAPTEEASELASV